MTVDVTTRPRTLESYVGGEWVKGKGQGQTLLDAATGAPVARIDSSGVDFAGALAWGRDVVGPKLRKLSFHERAAMLKALGQFLMANKEEFYAENFATGATRADGWIDIEGGAGTVLSYASKARRELPNTRVLTDGDVELLSKDATLLRPAHPDAAARRRDPHQRLQLPGVGDAGEGGTDLHRRRALDREAGEPDRLPDRAASSAASSSAGILPEGAIQLIAGSTGDLLDHVTGQDVVTFTGSAWTGRKLRSGAAIVENSTRFTMEADSLNAAILGPDAGPGTPEFDLFVKEVAREMTVKAGQKCTAIRRVIAPRAFTDALVAALGDRLAKTALGDPVERGDPHGRRSPASTSAARSASASASCAPRPRSSPATPTRCASPPATPRRAPSSTRSCSTPTTRWPRPPSTTSRPSARSRPSCPTTTSTRPSRSPGAARARSSPRSSPTTRRVAEEVVLGLAPFHGRVLIGNRLSAKTSTGHGSPLPVLVHGGPGRAGGGEELGGIRGVKHYMQRTAVQGAPRLLSAVTGRWIEGADARADGTHPFRKSLAELRIGDQLVTATRTVTLEDIEHFAAFTGDTFYAHMDEAAAKANPFFDGRVAHGYLIVSFAAGLFVDPAPGPVLANYGVDGLRFLTPVYPGDTLGVRLTCKEINPRSGAEHGEVRWDCQVTKQDGELVAQYDVLTMVAKTWPPAA